MVTGVTYGLLFVLGAVLGVVAGFEHAWYVGGSVPVAAVLWLAVLFAVPYGLGRLMKGKLAAAAPAVGWGVVSALFAGQRPEGDLVIAADMAGYAYLYGGMIVVAVAVVLVPSSGSWLLRSGPGARAAEGRLNLPR
jgi:hypothetical protein